MWSLFQQGELKADSTLTGVFARDESQTDPDSVLAVIEDARDEAREAALRKALAEET
jgi:RIO kinase 1